MPLYEYACLECHNHFELLVRESTKLECPKCESTDLEKQFSVFAPSSSTPAKSAGKAPPCGACGNPDGSCPADN